MESASCVARCEIHCKCGTAQRWRDLDLRWEKRKKQINSSLVLASFLLCSTGGYHLTNLHLSYFYNVRTRSYTAGPNIPESGYGFGHAKQESTKTLFIVGGNSWNGMIGSLHAFDMEERNYTQLPSTTALRAYRDCHVFDSIGKLLTSGGYTNTWSPASDVEIYDIVARTWSSGQALPNSASKWSGFVIGEGGMSTLHTLQESSPGVYKYDVDTNEWILVYPTFEMTKTPRSLLVAIDDVEKEDNCWMN